MDNDLSWTKNVFPEPKDRIMYALFTHHIHGRKLCIESLWNEFKRPKKEWLLSKLRELEHLGMIKLVEHGKRKEIVLTELGYLYGSIVQLYNFIQGMINLAGYFCVRFELRGDRDKFVSALIVNFVWTVMADFMLRVLELLILSRYNEEVLRMSVNILMHNLSHLLRLVTDSIDTEVFLNTLRDARKQAQKEFIKYLIEDAHIEELLHELKQIKRDPDTQRCYDCLQQVERLESFLKHLIYTAKKVGISGVRTIG